MALVISSYTIETQPRGFARCNWPAIALEQALEGARSLSEQANGLTQYPSAFWVLRGDKALCKYYRGKRYAPGDTV